MEIDIRRLKGYELLQTNEYKVTIRACLHGSGGPQVGEVTRLGGVTCLSI